MAIVIESAKDFLGRGLAAPMRRIGPADFVSAQGLALVRSCLRQVVGTKRGEVRWRPGFGVNLSRQRNKINNLDLENLVAADIKNAITVWEPRVEVLDIGVTRRAERMTVSVRWQAIAVNNAGNKVILGPDVVDVEI